MSTATSTYMITALFWSTGQYIQNLIPFLYMFFGLFLALFGLMSIIKYMKWGIKKVIK